MDNNEELKGLELLYYLMKRFNMSYNDAIKEMKAQNQDMSFMKRYNLSLIQTLSKVMKRGVKWRE